MTPRDLYAGRAALMLLDAFAYSFGALRQLHNGLAPRDPYLSKRLLLNLMLANAGCIFLHSLRLSERSPGRGLQQELRS